MRQSLFLMMTLLGSVAVAQAPQRPNAPADAVSVVTPEQMQTILQKALEPKTGKAAEVSTQLFPGGASCSFIRLIEPDAPHVHPVSEIYVMQAGSGTLETGGTMIGPFVNGGVHHQGDAPAPAVAQPQEIGPDHGGTALRGGASQVVKAGDVILVPAGVNHHWTNITQPLVYMDIKFPKVAPR